VLRFINPGTQIPGTGTARGRGLRIPPGKIILVVFFSVKYKSYGTQLFTLRGMVNECQLSGRVIIIGGDGGCGRYE